MAQKGKDKPLSREASLDSIPLRNPGIKADRNEDGTVLLRLPPSPNWWARMVMKLLRVGDVERNVSLDELGSFVWDECDGKTTVRDLIRRFAERFKLNRKEAEVSIAQFLRMLAKRGFMGIMVPQGKT